MDHWRRRGRLAPLAAALDDPAAPLWQHVDEDAARAVFPRWRRSGRWAQAWALAILNAWLADLADSHTLPPDREGTAIYVE
jgi:hypothetical protein